MQALGGKVAVVTGGGSGIGRALAVAFAAEGMHVAVLDYDRVAAESTAHELRSARVRSLAIQIDVSDRAAVCAAADQVVSELGGCHVLCNNAGVGINKPLLEMRDEDWDWILAVDLYGVIYGIQAFLPHMVRQGQGGHIVNTSSMAGMLTGEHPGMAAYRTAKYGVIGLSESLGVELAGYGIGCSVLCPGQVRTAITNSTTHRPRRFGGPATPGASRTTAGAVVEHGTDPKDVAALVVRAVQDDQFYIFTHDWTRGPYEARHQRILDAFDWARARATP